MTALVRKTIAIITLLCVLAHSLGACCAFAHVGCSHSVATSERSSGCSNDCCHDERPPSQEPCHDHDHQNCEHCHGGCFLVIVTIVSSLDLINALPVMAVAIDATVMGQVADSFRFAVNDDGHSFVRFAAPIFSQNQSLLI